MTRHGALARLGFASYEAYLHSPRWRAMRDRYANSDRPQDCGLCGASEELDLHHLTYERVGYELLTDLVRLCRRCHTMVHVLERRGDASISLEGIACEERAKAYFAQRAEAIARARDERQPPAERRLVVDPRTGKMRTLGTVVRDQSRSMQRLARKKQMEAERKAERRAARAAAEARRAA